MANVTSNGLWSFKPILSTSPIILDNKYKPNKIMHEFLYQASITGDNTGGYVQANLLFGSHFDINHFICITNILTFSTSPYDSILQTYTDVWDNTCIPSMSDKTISLWESDGLVNSYNFRDSLKKPIYLGRVRKQDSSPGTCWFKWSTNTDTEIYNLIIQGYTLERPLPFSSILQP